MFSSLYAGVRIPLGLIYLYNADWCNSNIIGSCPVYIGANPLSALYYKKGGAIT